MMNAMKSIVDAKKEAIVAATNSAISTRDRRL